jgi:hypothetical protein
MAYAIAAPAAAPKRVPATVLTVFVPLSLAWACAVAGCWSWIEGGGFAWDPAEFTVV